MLGTLDMKIDGEADFATVGLKVGAAVGGALGLSEGAADCPMLGSLDLSALGIELFASVGV